MNKINFFLYAWLLFASISCVLQKTYTVEEKKMRIGDDLFVVKKNGEKISGKKIQMLGIHNGTETWVKIDNEKIDVNEVIAYQNKDGYHINFEKLGDRLWPTQLKRGKINLFYYNGPDLQYSEHHSDQY